MEVRRGATGRREKFAGEWARKTDIKNTNVGTDMTE